MFAAIFLKEAAPMSLFLYRYIDNISSRRNNTEQNYKIHRLKVLVNNPSTLSLFSCLGFAGRVVHNFTDSINHNPRVLFLYIMPTECVLDVLSER